MKIYCSAFWKCLSVAVMLMVMVSPVKAVVGVTATLNRPSITNDFSGKVSLTIAGLSSGQTVRVERFTDINGNGAIDASQDSIGYSFTVTDGQLPLIGGIRNLNVAGDDDGSMNSVIRVDLQYPGVDGTIGGAAGKYVFLVSDPLGAGFSPVTATFEVKQLVHAQGVSGTITAATGGAALAGAFVALAPEDGHPVSAAYTDVSGNYTLNAPAAGSYILYIIRTNYVTDFNNTSVTISAGQFASKNVALASGVHVISGKVSDSANGNGIPGIFVAADADNKFVGAFSDANGNYSFSLSTASWEIRPEGASLAQVGYVKQQAKVTTNITGSGASTINFSVPKASALIYGTLKDNLNVGVVGISVSAEDQGGIYEGESKTYSPNGDYTIGVQGGSWSVSPDGDALTSRGYAGGAGTNVTVTLGQAVPANFVLQGVTARLRGQLRDGNGTPIPNIQIVVQPVPFVSSGAGSIYPSTDGSGNFDVGVRAGVWDIQVSCVDAQTRGYVVLGNFQFTVQDGVDQNNLVITSPAFTATITGTVKDSLNHGIEGVTVDANQNISGNQHYYPGCVSTDANGNYSIKVLGGTWQVNVRANELTARGYSSVAQQNPTISGGAAVANFVALPLPSTISAATFAGGQAQFSVATPAPITYSYTVQYSTNLKANSWTTLLTTNTTSGSFHFVDPSASNTFRFYRITSP